MSYQKSEGNEIARLQGDDGDNDIFYDKTSLPSSQVPCMEDNAGSHYDQKLRSSLSDPPSLPFSVSPVGYPPLSPHEPMLLKPGLYHS